MKVSGDNFTDLLRPRFGEDVPKSEGFVSGPGDDGLAVGGHGQIEDSMTMAGQFGHLDQRRIFPHGDLILGVAVR